MSAVAYYNEFDPYAAQWLMNLINAGHIAPGIVDTRSIEDVTPNDLIGFTQCHFFAGIGVWSGALRAAGWPDNRPVWTASCPCQPFSSAGEGGGFDDIRHLWPSLYHLISERRPTAIYGEQVASSLVAPWIDLVHADMEAVGYAFGCIPFPSAGVGAPHIRDRNYWLADSNAEQWRGWADRQLHADRAQARRIESNGQFESNSQAGRVANADHAGLQGRLRVPERGNGLIVGPSGLASGLEHAGFNNDASQIYAPGTRQQEVIGPANQLGGSGVSFNGLAVGVGQQRDGGGNIGTGGRIEYPIGGAIDVERPGPTNGFWRDADWLGCTDGKWRPVEPGTFPLASGSVGSVGRMRADQERFASIPRKDQGSRTGRLKGYGNAINIEAATAFIRATLTA